jgi:hypothetical protein
MIAVADAELMFGRRAGSRRGARVHAIRNDAFDQPVLARCEVMVGATVGQDQPVTCRRCRRLLAADAAKANAPYMDRIAAAEAGIRAAGFVLRYVDACEGDGIGGLIGMGTGVTAWRLREVRIRNMLTGASLVEVLEHELAHAEERPGYERGTHTLGAGGCG